MDNQRGVSLFFALISLLAMSLAAVALIRSVDTSTMISGNLLYKQSATTSAEGGINAVVTWLAATQAANASLNVVNNAAHGFNVTCLATRAIGTVNASDPGCAAVIPGYHSSADPAINLTATTTWNGVNDVAVGTDVNGNTIRYIIQRMCRNANLPVQNAGCLFSSGILDTNGQNILLPQDVCTGTECPGLGASPNFRVTVRVDGQKNTVSYVQAFVY